MDSFCECDFCIFLIAAFSWLIFLLIRFYFVIECRNDKCSYRCLPCPESCCKKTILFPPANFTPLLLSALSLASLYVNSAIIYQSDFTYSAPFSPAALNIEYDYLVNTQMSFVLYPLFTNTDYGQFLATFSYLLFLKTWWGKKKVSTPIIKLEI